MKKKKKTKSDKTFSKLVFFGFILFVLIASWSFLVEPRMTNIRRLTLDIPKWHTEHETLKFAVLSDFHISFGCMDRERLNKIISATNAENPDFVLLVGDYIDKADQNQEYISYLADFKNFKAKYGVYAVLGNHESWDVRSEIRYILRRAGVNVLENKAVKFTINKKTFWLAGIEDIETGFPSFEPIMKKRGNDNNPVILLSHNPDVYMKMPKGISITLSGHTHGGQIYIPFIANLVNPSRFGRKFLSGHVVRDDNHFYVGKGLGTTIIPARLFAQPEIAIIRFE